MVVPAYNEVENIAELVAEHRHSGAACTVLTARLATSPRERVRRDEQDRDLGLGALRRSQEAAHVGAADPRHHPVEKDEVRRLFGDALPDVEAVEIGPPAPVPVD